MRLTQHLPSCEPIAVGSQMSQWVMKKYYRGVEGRKEPCLMSAVSLPAPLRTPLEYFLFFAESIAKDGRCWLWLCEAQSFLTGNF